MTEIRRALRSLVELSPTPGNRFGVATRAALAMAVPFGVLSLLGHEDIGLQTAAGAFTTLFAASATARERAKVLPFVALALLLSAALGAILTPWHWAFAVGLVAVAVTASTASFAFRIGPPGPVFFVLVYGLAANITSVVDDGVGGSAGGAGVFVGHRANDPVVFLIAMGAGATFAYLLAIAPLLLPSARALPARSLRELLPGPWLERGEPVLVLRIAIAAAIGTAISIIWLDPVHAYWTVSASVAVTGLTASRSYALGRALHRTLGTVAGAALYLVLVPLGTDPIVLIPLFALLQFIIELVVVRNYALALTFITPLVLLLTSAAMPQADLFGTAALPRGPPNRCLPAALAGRRIAGGGMTAHFGSRDPVLVFTCLQPKRRP